MAGRFTVAAAIGGPKADGSAWGATPRAPEAGRRGQVGQVWQRQTNAQPRPAGVVETLARAWSAPLQAGCGRCGGAGIKERMARRSDGTNTRTGVQTGKRVWCA